MGHCGGGNYAGANGDYNSVVNQSGIKSGDGGFNIKVANNTDLKGAIISSIIGVNRQISNLNFVVFHKKFIIY
jgi:hypothetical protein